MTCLILTPGVYSLLTNAVPILLDEVRMPVGTLVMEGMPVMVPDVATGAPLWVAVVLDASTAGGQNVTV